MGLELWLLQHLLYFGFLLGDYFFQLRFISIDLLEAFSLLGHQCFFFLEDRLTLNLRLLETFLEMAILRGKVLEFGFPLSNQLILLLHNDRLGLCCLQEFVLLHQLLDLPLGIEQVLLHLNSLSGHPLEHGFVATLSVLFILDDLFASSFVLFRIL